MEKRGEEWDGAWGGKGQTPRPSARTLPLATVSTQVGLLHPLFSHSQCYGAIVRPSPLRIHLMHQLHPDQTDPTAMPSFPKHWLALQAPFSATSHWPHQPTDSVLGSNEPSPCHSPVSPNSHCHSPRPLGTLLTTAIHCGIIFATQMPPKRTV